MSTTIIEATVIEADAFGQLVRIDTDPTRHEVKRAIAGHVDWNFRCRLLIRLTTCHPEQRSLRLSSSVRDPRCRQRGIASLAEADEPWR